MAALREALRWPLVSLLVGVGACSSYVPPATLATAPFKAAPSDPACANVRSPSRVAIVRGKPTPFKTTTILFTGSEEELFDDGSTARVHTFSITSTEGSAATWRPDARDTARYSLVGGLCVRLIDGTSLDVFEGPPAPAAVPVPKADPAAVPPATDMPANRDCKKQCCDTPEKRLPAPDGTVECCMCDP